MIMSCVITIKLVRTHSSCFQYVVISTYFTISSFDILGDNHLLTSQL